MLLFWELLATAGSAGFAALLVRRWLWESGLSPARGGVALPEHRGERPDGGALLRVFCAALAFRLCWAVVSLLVYRLLTGDGVGLGELPALWSRWDAPHYIHLAELGYGGYLEEGKPLFLVFFPLYVWLVRGVTVLVGDTALAGMGVSWLCFGWGSVYVYRLAAEEYGRSAAGRSLALLWSFPFSFFFGGIMTESLFLLTTAAGLYHIRRHQWRRAAIWGVLAAMTRMQGVLLVGAAGAELFCQEKPFARTGKERGRTLLRMAGKLPLLAAPVLGSGVYFLLNYQVAGDPFAFVEMQKHWSQGFQWFPEVLAYLAKNAFTWPNVSTRWEMWIPELALFPLFAFLLWRSREKHRSMFTLYAFVYFILNYCLSWLLSAGRYLACALPFFWFGAVELEGRPGLTRWLTAGMGLLQMVFCFRYLCWGQVM